MVMIGACTPRRRSATDTLRAPTGARGVASVVPSLLDVADADPPFWPRLVEDVTAAMNSLDQDASVLLVAHSNAGLFVPLLAAHAPRALRGCLCRCGAPSAGGGNPGSAGRAAELPAQ